MNKWLKLPELQQLQTLADGNTTKQPARRTCLVHVAPEVAPPFRDDDGQRDVAADGDKHDQRDPRF